jgi:hypothetical protein
MGLGLHDHRLRGHAGLRATGHRLRRRQGVIARAGEDDDGCHPGRVQRRTGQRATARHIVGQGEVSSAIPAPRQNDRVGGRGRDLRRGPEELHRQHGGEGRRVDQQDGPDQPPEPPYVHDPVIPTRSSPAAST